MFANHRKEDNNSEVKDNQVGFTINATRIGIRGGLRVHAESVCECLATRFDDVDAVVPDGIALSKGIKIRTLPGWLSSSARVSKLRPLLWLAYSALRFPRGRSRRILSTTHHALPFHKHQILTVHDLRPYFEPDSWFQKFYFHVMLARSLRRCDGILTVSETSKREIARVYDIDQDKILVVPNAVETPPQAEASDARFPDHRPPYLLMVGASWKHKNALEVLEENGNWQSNFRLKIVAGAGQYSEQLKQRAQLLGITDKVEFLHDVSEEELAALYRGCSALVYPSRMEGFGLPPLEAMTYGKPAIVSDIPVFRELLEDAPFYVELGNSASWSRAFGELSEPGSGSEKHRRRRGYSVASKYTRERMCGRLTEALEKIWGLRPSDMTCSNSGR
ncbi:MAG TPA: glycosyltransferase family 1 protein [Acidobacteriaceae bacterium]|jgi:glycosyltransferase involved in cell wall biosynthesis